MPLYYETIHIRVPLVARLRLERLTFITASLG
jgi:hypothetical protein